MEGEVFIYRDGDTDPPSCVWTGKEQGSQLADEGFVVSTKMSPSDTEVGLPVIHTAYLSSLKHGVTPGGMGGTANGDPGGTQLSWEEGKPRGTGALRLVHREGQTQKRPGFPLGQRHQHHPGPGE